MEDNETIVIDIQLDEAGIQKRLAEVGTSIRSVEAANRQLKQSIKESGDEFGINAKLMAQNEVLLKSLKAEQSALSGQIRAGVQSYQKYGTSIKELTAQMNALKEEYRSLSREDRESDIGHSLKQQIGELRQEINEANHSLGDFQDNVGNYPGAVEPVTTQIKELTKALIDMKVAGQENTAEYQELLQKLGELKDATNDAQQEIKNMASDTRTLDSVLGAAQLTAGAMSTAMGVMALLGKEDSETAKEIAEAQKKLQAAIAITNGVMAVQNALGKSGALMRGVYTVQTWAAKKAQDAYTAATGRATVAQRIFNTVAKSNPYVLLATAILSVVGALGLFSLGQKESEKDTAKANVELRKQIEYLKELNEMYGDVTENAMKQAEHELEMAKIRGASAEEIYKKEDAIMKLRREALDAEIARTGYSKQEYNRLSAQYQMALDNYNEQVVALKKLEGAEYGRVAGMQIGLETAKKNLDNLKEQLDVLQAVKDKQEEYQRDWNRMDKERQAAKKKENDNSGSSSVKTGPTAEEIANKRLEATRKIENELKKLAINEAKDRIDIYVSETDKEINELKHRLDTERGLTITERYEINQKIIDLELEKNKKLAELEKNTARMEVEEEYRLKKQGIEDELKELEKSNALKGEKGLELQNKYNELKEKNEKEYQAKLADIDREYTDKISAYQMDATKETLENQEEELQLSYERREQLRQIAADKRLLEAGNDEEALAEAELQNAIEEQAALLALDAETKEAMGMTQEQYELAVLQSEKNIQKAKEKTIQVQTKQATMQMKAIGDIFGSLSEIMSNYAEESEDLAKMEKVLSLAKIAMSTGVAIAEGIATASEMKPWPVMMASIATTVATVLANIATAISTVKSAKFAEGGIVAGTSYYGDQVNARLNSGEMVLNREQQANLFRMIEQPRTIGSTAELTEAFSAALSEMPNPVLEYTEFRQFTENVNEQTNKTIIR